MMDLSFRCDLKCVKCWFERFVALLFNQITILSFFFLFSFILQVFFKHIEVVIDI